MNEAVKVALAGLLHDIGKFSQRVSNEQRWRHDAFTKAFLSAFKDKLGEAADKIVNLAATHHKQVTDYESMCVKVADLLASAERQRRIQPQVSPERAALMALPSQVQLGSEPPSPVYLPLGPLTLDESVFFPKRQEKVESEDYQRTWDEFTETLRCLPSNLSFSVWQTLLQVYTHAIPSATPWGREPERRTVPDISLFHHARLTAAIATCLASLGEENLPRNELSQLLNLLSQFEASDFVERLSQDPVAQKPLCLLVRGDVAGIQSWLYRIARAEGEEHRRTAKRLRGRSFYLVLLTEAIANWFCRKANVPPCNVLFCGGGVFDVLLPATFKPQLTDLVNSLDEWLLEEFHGDLRINLAWITLTAADFYNFGSVYRRVTAKLERSKRRTFVHRLNRDDSDDFWFHSVADICRFCDTTPFAKPGEPCPQCQQQEQLGDTLRQVGKQDYLVWAFGDARKTLAKAVNTAHEPIVKFSALECEVALVSEATGQQLVASWDGEGELVILKRNDPKGWWRPLQWNGSKPLQAGIWWAATDAPVAKRKWRAPTKSRDDPDFVREGEALDFDEIAALSTGDALLGVLRMDVDNLGALFAVGVDPPSPSRTAELSGRMDAFFTGWLLQRCQLVTKKWQKNFPDSDERKGLVDNAFYLAYAGGDDVMVIGPWDLTLQLAVHIRDDFVRYSGCNPNLTISAGVVFVKPKFPIHRFAVLSGEALERSKELGRNRITAFNTTVTWDDCQAALKFGEEMTKAVAEDEVPRTFLHFLWRLYRDHKKGSDPMWVPLLHYTVARRLKIETVEKLRLLERIPQLICQRALPIALGFAIMATRERAGVMTKT